MKKYKVTDYIAYNCNGGGVKYLFPGDELIFIEEFKGGGSSTRCVVTSKTFAHNITREKIVLSRQLDKVEPCDYTEI